MRFDIVIIHFFYLFNKKFDQAMFTLIGQYYMLFFLIQPLIIILLNDSQRNNGYMMFRNFFLSILCLGIFVINETFLLEKNKYYQLLYLVPLFLYSYAEMANSNLMKVFYSVLCMYNESNFFDFHGLNFYMNKQNERMKSFKHQIDDCANKNKNVYFKKIEGKSSIWKNLQFVVRDEKENRIEDLKTFRRKKVGEYLTLIKHQKLEMAKEFKSESNNENINTNNMDLPEGENMKEGNRKKDNNSIEMVRLSEKSESILVSESQAIDKKFKVYSLSKFKTDQFNIPKKNICKRLRKLMKKPKHRFNKILHFMLFPIVILFRLTLPSFDKKQTLKSLYFGFIGCTVYLCLFSLAVYQLNNILQYYWNYSNLFLGFINSVPQLSFVLYCFFSRIINEYYLNTYFMEVIIVDFSMIIIPKIIYGIFVEAIVDETIYYCLVTVSTIIAFNLVSCIVNIIFKGYIPQKFHYVMFLGLIWLVIEFFVKI